MVPGGFKNDLLALNDTNPHDDRYVRLVEYTTIIKLLLSSPDPVTFGGKFYKVDKLRMTPALAPELLPGILISGSSDAGLAAAEVVGAVAVQYPKPAKEYETIASRNGLRLGMRVGILARAKSADAWNVAYERFPGDRKGQIAHELAMKSSDSQWHTALSKMARELGTAQGVCWVWPFENYKTFCPYLVGNDEDVSEEVSRCLQVGYRTFILDIPPNREELRHVQTVFQMASERTPS